MNYGVHAVMYAYYALQEAGYKRQVAPWAGVVTTLQISQMAL